MNLILCPTPPKPTPLRVPISHVTRQFYYLSSSTLLDTSSFLLRPPVHSQDLSFPYTTPVPYEDLRDSSSHFPNPLQTSKYPFQELYPQPHLQLLTICVSLVSPPDLQGCLFYGVLSHNVTPPPLLQVRSCSPPNLPRSSDTPTPPPQKTLRLSSSMTSFPHLFY